MTLPIILAEETLLFMPIILDIYISPITVNNTGYVYPSDPAHNIDNIEPSIAACNTALDPKSLPVILNI
jgi:hypothetical protein